MPESIVPTFQINEHLSIGARLRLVPSKKILGRDGYIVAEPFYLVDEKGYSYFFDEGFTSDGGTIPWWARPMFPSGGRAIGAFLVHDQGCDLANKIKAYVYRAVADGRFFRHLRECGYAKWRASLMTFAVMRYGEMLKAKGELE